MSVPTIEYDIEYDTTLDEGLNDCLEMKNIVTTIYNLSRTQKFSDLKFILRLPTKHKNKVYSGEFKYAGIHPIPPSYISREAIVINEHSVTYPSTGIHPGTALRLVACYSGVKRPTFHIAEDSEAVRPIARGALTWIIRNEITVLLVLLVVWTFTTVLLVAYGAFKRNKERS